MMRVAGRLAGILGVVLLITTPLTWWLSGGPGPFVAGKLALALTGLAFYLSTDLEVLWGALRRVRGRIQSAAVVLLALLVCVLVNLAVRQYPIDLDVTRSGFHTLSEKTLSVLRELGSDTTVYAFYSSSDQRYASSEEILARYARESRYFHYEMIEPQSRPDLLQKYTISEGGPRLVLWSGGREAYLKDFSEQQLTNALVRSTRESRKTIGFLRGHGELDFDDSETAEGAGQIRELVVAEGFTTRVMSLLEAKPVDLGTEVNLEPENEPPPPIRVPPDIEVLVVAGTQARIPQAELLAMEEYLLRGGRLLLLLEPAVESGLESLAAAWKVDVRDDFVIDSNAKSRALGLGAAAPQIFPTQPRHAITRALPSSVIFSTARSVDVLLHGETGVQAQAILAASDSAWGETSYSVGAAGFDPRDHAPPIHTAVLSTRAVLAGEDSKEARLLVFGDADWINNRHQGLRSNADLFLNAVDFLADEEDQMVIRPRSRASSALLLTGRQMAGLRIVILDFIPALLVALGFAVVTQRRRR